MLQRPRGRASSALVVSIALASGCATSANATPEATAAAFATAVRRGDYDTAYRRLSARTRAELPFDEFVRRLEANPDEVRELAARLARPSDEATITADLPFGDGERIALVYDDGAWRIVGNVLDPYDQSTPRAALRAFVRAAENRRYDVLLRLAPAAEREGMSEEQLQRVFEGEQREEIERLVHILRENLENPIERVGDRATMPYLERFRVQFVREEGLWRIEDPD